jgi:arylsulfatase A-like enzyme
MKRAGMLLVLAAAGCASPPPRAGSAPPDIVLILADDLGWGDLGVRTPAIDRLAAQGVRFTRFYSSGAECTPTRTALLTGRYPQRVGGLECAIGTGNVGRYDDAVRLRERDDLGLPASESALARLLRAAGYATAVVGKWHLGYEPKFFPERHGFDSWFGPLGGGVDYFHHTEPDGTPMLFRDGRPTRRDGYLTDLLAEEAVAFLLRPHDRPRFLYLPFTAPHLPGQGPDDRRDRPLTEAEWSRTTPATYAAMIERLDRRVGDVLDAIDASGRASRTIVIFTSDNGATSAGSNGPLSGRKGTLYEGGIRVPCIVRWPGVLPQGATSDRVCVTMDLTASLVRAAGAPPDRPFDGREMLTALGSEPRTLFWRHRRGTVTWRAAREGDLKYVTRSDGGRIVEEKLFDLAADPAEKSDLLAARGEDVRRLGALLAAWEADVRPLR